YRCSAFLNAMLSGQKGLAVTLNEEKTLKLKACSVPKAQRTEPPPRRCHNHFEGGGVLCTKRGLCESLVAHFLHFGRDPFGAVPLTFLVHGSSDPQFAMFEDAYRYFSDESKQRIWIVKPAEWANRGCGIRIFKTIEEVRARVDAKERAWAIQKYIEKPLLVHGRKFDIRAYCLLLQDPTNWSFKAFYYRDAYLRTTSAQYTTKNLDRMVHLNNDAVQKHGDNYGKFESANKMSLDEFQKYLDEHHVRTINVREDLMPQIQGLMADAVQATVAMLLGVQPI
ncbi:TTLL3, partial [Symbiodinium sp. KB8]